MSYSDEDNVFLSMHAPAREIIRVQAAPSAIFELMHVGNRLTPRVRQHKRSAWIEELIERRPNLGSTLFSFWDDDYPVGIEIPFVASYYGYIRDTDPLRFFQSLPELMLRNHRATISRLETSPVQPLPSEADIRMTEVIDARIARLSEADFANLYAEIWLDIWQEMEPLWQSEGLPLCLQAAEKINKALLEGKNVLDIVPREHFGHLERYSSIVTTYSQQSFVLVTPMYFINVGGHTIYAEEMLCIGYGVQHEHAIHALVQRSQALAQQVKALADPTRLMILSLISEFKHDITVGDLAKRFSVSQPTISGHLKILREAELVQVAREGNRAYYSADLKRITDLMLDVEALIMPTRDLNPQLRERAQALAHAHASTKAHTSTNLPTNALATA